MGINTLKLDNKYTNQELVEGIAKSDNIIINYIYLENFKSIRHFIVANSGNEYDAKDVFQETMVVLFRKVRDINFQLTSSLNTYIYSVAKLIWLKELGVRNKSPEFYDSADEDIEHEPNIIELIEHNEKVKFYREKFEELSEDCKKVIRLFLNKIALKDITTLMGYSSDQHAKNRYFRCKKSLISRIKSSSKFKELGK